MYYYDVNQGQAVDFTYKALSSDPWLQDDFAFFAVDDPNDSLSQGNELPGVGGLMVIDEQNPTPRQFNLAGLKQI